MVATNYAELFVCCASLFRHHLDVNCPILKNMNFPQTLQRFPISRTISRCVKYDCLVKRDRPFLSDNGMWNAYFRYITYPAAALKEQ